MADLHLDLDGARIAYDLTGPAGAGTTERVPGASTVVVAHGLTASRAGDDAGEVFDWSPLAERHRVVRYDARGHGASTGSPDPASYAWPALADDLLALLDAVSPDAPVDAVGASMGTATILWAATRRPERFRRLVLTIPPTAWATRAAQADGYEQGALAVERLGLATWVRAGAAQPQIPVLAAGGFPRGDAGPAVPEALLPSALRGAALSDLPDAGALAALPHPALVLPWTTDPGHPVSTAERLAELLPAAVLEVADTPDAIRGWGRRAAGFLSA
ncbi:alpha/beta fold hydrolase [Cellulomonas sp. IC4_254]|uniref:alpha/beta fold hydrolase n=1 Tax=Cellulomonas sp. IC4_254 TaxID=2714040 RepID=UPI0014238DA5|nr:alpha/beta fold hydrolase [Cellulomonas sp. IC4_254]NHT17804.1 alpha/beta fold hydrolase [Cellulomonas sp. IC4_254]